MYGNTLETVVMLAGPAAFLVLAGTLLGGLTGTVIGLLLGLALVGGSSWFSDRVVVRAARARPVAPGELAWLQDDLADGRGVSS